jgi:hypothetical protein
MLDGPVSREERMILYQQAFDLIKKEGLIPSHMQFPKIEECDAQPHDCPYGDLFDYY